MQIEEGATVRDRVMAFLGRFGEVMGNIVLGVLYFVLLGPIALVGRLFSDPMRTRRPEGTCFLEWQEENETLAEAHRQG